MIGTFKQKQANKQNTQRRRLCHTITTNEITDNNNHPNRTSKSTTLHYSHYSTTASTTRTTSQISTNTSLFLYQKQPGKHAVTTSNEPMKTHSAKDSRHTRHSSMRHSMVNGTAETQGHRPLSGLVTENGEPKYKSATDINVWYTIFITQPNKETL